MGVKRRGVNTHLVGPKGAKKFEGRNDYENPGTRVFAAKPTPEGWPLGGEGMVTAEKDPEMKKVKVEMFRVGKGWILKEQFDKGEFAVSGVSRAGAENMAIMDPLDSSAGGMSAPGISGTYSGRVAGVKHRADEILNWKPVGDVAVSEMLQGHSELRAASAAQGEDSGGAVDLQADVLDITKPGLIFVGTGGASDLDKIAPAEHVLTLFEPVLEGASGADVGAGTGR